MNNLRSIISVASVLAILTHSPISRAEVVESQELKTARSELLKLERQRDKVRNYAYRDGGEDDSINQQIRKEKEEAEESWREQKLKVLGLEIDDLNNQGKDFNEKTIEIWKNHDKNVRDPARNIAVLELRKKAMGGELKAEDLEKELDKALKDVDQKLDFKKTEEFQKRLQNSEMLGRALDQKLKERGDVLLQQKQYLADRLAKAKAQAESKRTEVAAAVVAQPTPTQAGKDKAPEAVLAKSKAKAGGSETNSAPKPAAKDTALEAVKPDKNEAIKTHDEKIARLEKLLKDTDEMIKKVDKSPGTIMFYNMFKATGDSYRAQIDILKKEKEEIMKQ